MPTTCARAGVFSSNASGRPRNTSKKLPDNPMEGDWLLASSLEAELRWFLDRIYLMRNLSRIVLLVQLLLPVALVAQSSGQSPGGAAKGQGKPKRPSEPLEIAPFGRVITCDLGRRDGTRISRLVEFSVGELFLENEIMPDGQGLQALHVPPQGLRPPGPLSIRDADAEPSGKQRRRDTIHLHSIAAD